MLLKDKVIVISGVGPGMGRSLALIAAAEGAMVGLGSRSRDFLNGLVDEIEAAGGKAIARVTDVTDARQCSALAEATQAAFGKIDGLINSAYLHGDWMPSDVADPADFAGVFDVTCTGALRMAQACLPALKESKGAVVNISTMSTVNPFPGEAAYAAAKGAMNALTRHMAMDFGRFGIRVNVTRMGWIGGAPVWAFIDGQVAAGRNRDEVIGEITARIPIGIIPPEEDCAKAVLFMVSDYSKVVSGASLDVNGGQYMAP
ncbi:SDR family oxidoreductase [soil metagenome]